jgi:predicted phosphodiesterase
MNFENVITLGDIHSHFDVIITHIEKFDIEKSLYIQVGDFGIGFYKSDKKNMRVLNNKLVKTNNFLYAIRGNHDDPQWFKDDVFVDFKKELTNIKFVQDYTTMDINDETYLFIGGAVSIDRVERIEKNTGWWEDEIVNYDYDFCENVKGIDRVICHTSPNYCPPFAVNNATVMDRAVDDPTLLQDLVNERTQMAKIIGDIQKNNDLKSFHYGHFHRSSKYELDGCNFICLGINEFSLIN